MANSNPLGFTWKEYTTTCEAPTVTWGEAAYQILAERFVEREFDAEFMASLGVKWP